MSFPTEPPEKLLPEKQQENATNTTSTPLSPSQERLPGKARAGSILSPLKVRDYRLLFGGQLISTIGDAFYAVALPWLVLTSGGNAQELGIILSGYGIPRVGSVLLGGVLSDRLRPRRVMLMADTVRAVLVGILAALAFIGHPALWQLLLVAIPLGAFEGLFLPASFSMLPEVLEDTDLQAGNALNTSSYQLASLVGSGAGGIVVGALKSGVALAFDAFSFVASALSLAIIRGRPRSAAAPASPAPQAEPAAEGLLAAESLPGVQAIEGAKAAEQPVPAAGQSMTFWQLARTSRVLQTAFLVSLFANMTFGGLLEVALPTLAHGQLAAGAGGYGAILAASALGHCLAELYPARWEIFPTGGRLRWVCLFSRPL